MEIKEILEVLQAFDSSGCELIEVEDSKGKIRIEKARKSVATEIGGSKVENDLEAYEDAIEESGLCVKSPIVGVYYSAPAPDEKPYVSIGSLVKKGQVLCLVEAMKMMNEITAPKDGKIEKIFLKNQDVVEYDTPLFVIVD